MGLGLTRIPGLQLRNAASWQFPLGASVVSGCSGSINGILYDDNFGIVGRPGCRYEFDVQWRELTTDGVLILELSGEIDLQHSPEMRRLLQARAAQRIPALLLDFTGVKYIDSSGLATLIEYYQSSRAYDGKIIVAGLSHRVRSIFELVRLNEVFPIYATVLEARQALQHAPTPNPSQEGSAGIPH